MEEMPSSPPLDPRYRATSPTSSEPPLFSSDDPPDVADIANYESPRQKRKRAGPWWENEVPVPERKKSKMSRNFDSGVWLQSDATDGSDSIAVAPLPQQLFTSEAETAFRQIISRNVDLGSTNYHLDGLALSNGEIDAIGELNLVIQAPPGADVDVPAEGQYRSMEPELYVNLSRNDLSQLPGTLFSIQYLSTLVLRDNKLEELPPAIGIMRNLKELDLSRNSLRWLPPEILGLLPARGGRLDRLQLIGNPLLDHQIVPTHLQFISGKSENLWPGWSKSERPFMLARSPIVYYDEVGSVIPGSPSLPPPGEVLIPVVMPPRAPFVITPRSWFEPPSRSKVSSLFRRCLQFAIQSEGVDDTRHKLGDYVSPLIHAMLSRAEHNAAAIHSPLRRCHVCTKEYIVAAAEWIEFWTDDFKGIFPLKLAVCEWGCIPDEFAGRPSTAEEISE